MIVRFWLNMYHRFDSALLPKENIPNTLTHMIDHTISLNDHARLLEKVIEKKEILLTQTNEALTNEIQRMKYLFYF